MSKWLCVGRRKSPAVLDVCDCSHLNLVDLPKELLEHRGAIKSLNLNSNAIKDIPKALYHMLHLEDLDLSDNEVIFLSPSISNLSHLTRLTLSKNSLSNVPDAIKQCHSLLSLDISGNPLGELCDGIMELRQLRKLVLNDVQMEELPPNIGKLEKLEILELRENMLQSLPSSLSHLTLLERLDLGTNEFVNLPRVIGNLESLSELWLDTNIISVLPEEVGNLYNLRFLELSENHLVLLPDSLVGWSSLTHLYLSDNLISLVPAAIENLGKLAVLKLDHNRLGGLPDTLDGLYSVSELSLAHNHLSELPPSIGGMTSLYNLNLDDNLLTQLPAEIGLCSSLSILSVCNNHLVELPADISSLSSLSVLSLTGNQLQHLPYTLTRLPCISAIWMAGNQSRPIVDLQLTRDHKGEKCLTCYLLPQQGHEPPLLGGSPPGSVEGVWPLEAEPLDRRASQVNFDVGLPAEKPNKSSLLRDPTPFPKELHAKAMQWRAAREAAVRGEGGVTRRVHVAERRSQNRNSLLTALANPLDDDLLSATASEPQGQRSAAGRKGRQARSHSREATPHPTTIPEGAELASNEVNVLVSPTSKASQTSFTNQPLPPPYSPEGLMVHSVQSGPTLDPPKEFAPLSLHHGNGNGDVSSGTGIRHGAQQVSSTDSNVYQNLPSVDAQQQMFVVANGNNNNNNNMKVTYSSVVGMIRSVEHAPPREHFHADSVPPRAKEQRLEHFHANSVPPRAKEQRLEHFHAKQDNDSSQPWYTTPERSSPQGAERGPAYPPPAVPPGVIREYAQLNNNLVQHSMSQDSTRETTGHGDYDRLQNKHHRVGVVSGSHGYHNCYPLRGHSRSHSSDTAEVLGVMTARGCGSKADHVPSQAGASSPQAQNYHRLERKGEALSTVFRLHGDPLPTTQQEMLPSLVREAHNPDSPHHREVLTSDPTQATPFWSHSQPETMLEPLPPPPDSSHSQLLQHHRTSSKIKRSGHVTSAFRHAHSTQQDPQRYPPQRKNFKRKAQHVLSNESIFQNTVQNGSALTPEVNGIHDAHSHGNRSGHVISPRWNSGAAAASGCHRQQLSLDDTHLYSNLEGLGLTSGTPEGSQAYSNSGQDSGFEGMKKESWTNVNSQGLHVEVVLRKNPSLGFGITGGRDGVNVINPGDKGFYVHKLLEGLPAQKSGKIAIGDQLLEVNGFEVSSLSTSELVHLLTGPGDSVTLHLYRKPSLTLL